MPPLPYDQYPELAVKYKVQPYEGAQLFPFKMKVFQADQGYEDAFYIVIKKIIPEKFPMLTCTPLLLIEIDQIFT